MKRSEAKRSTGKVLNAYASGREVVSFYRDSTGELHRRADPVAPTCFILVDELTPTMARELQHSSVVTSFKRSGEYYRVEWKDPDDLHRLTRKGGLFDQREIRTFEADVTPVRRWMTDNPGLTVDKPRRCYLDLEADSRVSFQQKRNARILCWAVVDDETGEAFSDVLGEDEDADERDLLLGLWRTLARYDQVCAWSGDRYDFPLLEERTAQRGIEVDMRRWLWLDQLVLFRRSNVTASESGEEKQSFSLDAVSKVILGEGKLTFDEDELEGLDEDEPLAGQAWELWCKHPRKLVEYCEDDAGKLHRIEQKTGYIGILQAVSESCASFPDTRGANPTQYVEGFIMRLGAAKGMRFRTHQYEEGSAFKGAFVADVHKGLHRDEVHVVDFSKMYPSIIISWNMSPETLRPEVRLKEDLSTRPSYLSHLPQATYPLPEGCCASADDVVFRCEPLGILPEALLEITAQRKKWSDLESKLSPGTPEWQAAHRGNIAYKQISNCFYGVISSPFSRFFDKRVGQAITQTGVWLIRRVIDECAKRGWKSVLADTDSNGFQGCTREEAAAFVGWCNEVLFPEMLAGKRCPRNSVKLSYEKAFRRLCIIVKKRYFAAWAHKDGTEAGVDSKPEIKGLEYKRGDSARMTRQLQKEIIYALLGFDEGLAEQVNAIPKDDHAARAKARLELAKLAPAPVEASADLEPIVERYMRAVFDEPIKLEDVVQSKKLAKGIGEYVRREKKKAPPVHKLRGEDVVVTYTDHDCPDCESVPASELELSSAKCPQCGAKWRRRTAAAKGMVVNATGERITVSDGRRSTFVWAQTIGEVTALASLPPHVQVARQLQQRGRDVGKGVRVEFVVVDDDDPFGTIPAEDFDGRVDKHALWETVFRPTLRVLEVAFPSHQWSKYLRPKPQAAEAQRVRVRREAAKKSAPRQGALF